MPKYREIECPDCKEIRTVTYGQWWNIFKKKSSSGKCPKCKDVLNISGLEKGHGWNKGLKKELQPRFGDVVSNQTKEKLREKNIGRKMTSSDKSKMREKKIGKIGNLANNWQGGKTDERRTLMSREEYKQWRMNCFERDEYTCQCCEKVGGKLECHHIKSWSEFPELRLDINNGITLCRECHKLTDNYGAKSIKK